METTAANDPVPVAASTAGSDPEGTLPVIREHIVRTPGTCWGKPRIAGTRIKVEQVVIWHEQMGMAVSEIVSNWPHLDLADVYAALAYYHDHRDEIDRDLAEGEKRFEDLKATQPSIQEKIRLRELNGADDQVSSE